MTQKKDQLIVRLLNLRGDDSTPPSDFLKYSIQQIYHFIEVEEEKREAKLTAEAAAAQEPEAPPTPKSRSAFDDFFGWGR
jgi:hypothetical protein